MILAIRSDKRSRCLNVRVLKWTLQRYREKLKSFVLDISETLPDRQSTYEIIVSNFNSRLNGSALFYFPIETEREGVRSDRPGTQLMKETVTYFPSVNMANDQPSRVIAMTNTLGVTMPNPNNPRGWSINPATVSLTLIVAFLLISGAYYQGVRDTETRQLMDKLEKIEKTAQQAKDFSMSSAARLGHEPTNTNTNGGH